MDGVKEYKTNGTCRDATQVPKDADKIPSVGLYNITADGAPDALLIALASSFEPARGAVSVTVPQTVAPGSYVVKSTCLAFTFVDVR